MPLLSLLAALTAAQLQISFGQQISDGVVPQKLSVPKQSQNQTDAASVIDPEQNLILAKNWEKNILNNSSTFPSQTTITNIKFVRNPAYDGPAPSFSVMNNKNVADSGTSARDSMPVNLQSALSSGVVPNAAGQMASKQSEHIPGSILKSPVFISLAPRFAGAVSSHTPYCINYSPAESVSTNMAPNPSSFSPPLKQQSYQTFSSAQYQPLNMQNPSNIRLRFVPASTTGPIQNTLPIQSTVPTCNTVPIQNTIPIQNTVPMQIFDNTIQNPHLSLLLAHLFSQCPVRQEQLTPSVMRSNQEQKPSKLTVVKTLLPLLLELLEEKDSNCCEYKNERSRTNTKFKQGSKQFNKLGASSLEHGTLSRTADQRHRVSQIKVSRKPYDDSVEDEDYSNESSDYTAEDYDDEH